ncbi:MAG: DNA internalization-related competence protein ComEC/Rec2 [Oliverpabstia sp.]
MKNRPLCLAVLILVSGIWLGNWLGISWIWRSPAGREPIDLAAESGDTEADTGLSERQLSDGESPVEAEGIVCQQEEKSYQEYQTITYLYLKQTNLYINSKKYPIRTIKCKIEGTIDNLYGYKLRVAGKLVLPQEPGNPGEFNRVTYERSRKIDFYLEEISRMETISPAGKIQIGFESFRNKCRNIIYEIFPQNEADIMAALLLGEKQNLDEKTKSEFQSAGISHIMAISGLHISMLGAGLWNALRWMGIPMSLSSFCSLLVLIGYGILIGSPTTAVRALIMFGLMLGARILGRTYDFLSALAMAGILLLLDNPDLLMDSGFQMSFAAVVGMGTYVEWQIELCRDLMKGRKGEYVGGKIVAGVSIWLFMLPVVLHTFYQVSVIGIICNLVILPLMPLVLGSGFLALILGYWGAGPGSLLGLPAYGIVRMYEWLGEAAQSASAGVWTPGKPSLPAILIYYGILAGVCITCSKMKEKRPGKILLIHMTGIMLMLFLMASPWKYQNRITVLDVGQGDGIVLQTGRTEVLVDGGSSSRNRVGKYVILPFMKYEGISRLEAIFLTHTDQDHLNGAIEVLEESKKGWLIVEQVFLPWWMKNTEEGEQIRLLAKEVGTACSFLKAGDKLSMGKAKIKVLHPNDEDYSHNPNGGSLVFIWEIDGMRALFTGDLPLEEENKILYDLPGCEILKTAHHGSNGSTSKAFLEKINPKVALISCGKNNYYGHPGEETLSRLQESCCQIFRTDEQGALIVTEKSEGWTVEGYR